MKHFSKLCILLAVLSALVLAGCSKPTDTVPQDNKEQETQKTTEEQPEEKACVHEWVLDSDTATCTTDGIKTFVCKLCEEHKTENSPAHHHEDYETSGYCETCGAYKYENKFSFYIFTSEDDWKVICKLNEEEFNKQIEYALNNFSFEKKDNNITLDKLIQLKSKYKNYKVGWYSHNDYPWNRRKYDSSNEPSISNVNAIILVPKAE